jgi:hypothetical protein
MAFTDKKLLLSTERCIDYVTIGNTVYMSVYNASSGYTRVYASVAGGPLVNIKGNTQTSAYRLFKLGNQLYAGWYVNNLNNFRVDRYTGSGWVQDGFMNGGYRTLRDYKEHDGKLYLLISGYGPGALIDGATYLVQYNTGGFGNFTLLRSTSGVVSRNMRSFTIDPDTDLFYIADCDQGTGPGNMSIYSWNPVGGATSTLISWGSGVEPYGIRFYDGELYLTRNAPYPDYKVVISKLSDLTTGAVEEILDNTAETGLGAIGFARWSMEFLHDLLVFQYHKSNADGFVTYNVTEDEAEVLPDYAAPSVFDDRFGTMEVIGDDITAGVQGKFIGLYHQAPDDPNPPEPPPGPVEDLTEDLLIEVREAPCNPITLLWLNSLGAWESFSFEDKEGTFETEIKTRIDAEYERYVEYLDTDTNSTGITSKSVSQAKKIGAENIHPDIYVGLIDLFTSPAVFVLVSKEPITWQSVRVSPGSIRYSKYEHTIELTVEYPNLFIQRS